MPEVRTVLMMAGGTGGHVFPALAVARELRDAGMTVQWLGTARGIESELIPAAGLPLHCLDITGLRGKGVTGLLAAPLRIIRAVWQARRIIKRIKPDVVVGFGGYATGPGGVAARLAGVPLIIHEQNAIAGLTNRLLSRISQRVLQAFPGALPGAVTVGNPVRQDVVALPAPAERWAGREQEPLRVLVVGGSLGAVGLNAIVLQAMQTLPPEQRPQLRHQAGKNNAVALQQQYQAADIEAEVLPFIDDMAAAYAWADLVVCRAGALTVAEVAAAGCAALLVPFPFAVDDHQTANARYLADQQAALLQQQKELDGQKLAAVWQQFAGHKNELQAMAERARALAITTATQSVVQHIKGFCRG